ncbi:MAG: hypothetical protein ACOYND_09020 [Bacteroidota bacterium]
MYRIVMYYTLFLLLNLHVSAEKNKGKAVPSIKELYSHEKLDIILQSCSSDRKLHNSCIDTNLLFEYIRDIHNADIHSIKDNIEKLTCFMNAYHALLLKTLLMFPHALYTKNEKLFDSSLICIDNQEFNLSKLKEHIAFRTKSIGHIGWFGLWDGTISGAHRPKRAFRKHTLLKVLQANAKAYFVSRKKEFSCDFAKKIIRVSDQLFSFCHLNSEESEEQNKDYILNVIMKYAPDDIAAFTAINKKEIEIMSIEVSDKIDRDFSESIQSKKQMMPYNKKSQK